jgi:UDP-N-acetylglucosamine 2-epimerase (non-hydrolysing)
LRDTTERPETVEAGGNVLCGVDTAKIALAARKMMRVKRAWKNPFGDGHSARRMVDAVRRSK